MASLQSAKIHQFMMLNNKETFTREDLKQVYLLEKQKLVDLWASNIKTKVIEAAKYGDTYESFYVHDSDSNNNELGKDILPQLLKKLAEIFPDSIIAHRKENNRITIDWSIETE